MNPAYLRPIADHLWQSTLFAGVAGLLTLALRNDRARARYWLWVTASCKFLVPFSVLVALGSDVQWRTAPQIMQSGLSIAVKAVSEPFAAPTISVPLSSPSPAARPSLPELLSVIWICGFAGIAFSWWVRWRRILETVGNAAEVRLSLPVPVRSSPNLLEPGIFGIWRPILLLPEGIFQRLPPAQLQAVINHELCHFRYRDNLVAAIHMFVETVFWFHPLLWWIGKRMVEERERACDAEVLRLGADPQVYAEGILSVCRPYVESPLVCVSGVSGANLRKRIAVILNNHVASELSFAKKAALTVAALAALVLPITLGMMSAPAIRAQSAPSGDSAGVLRAKFEVASIKPCRDGDFTPGRKGGGPGGRQLSPATLHLDCSTVMDLIKGAYVLFANGHVNPRSRVPVEGGPAWINSVRYQIDAKANGARGQGMMRGPMLQTLLEDRFRLKIHRETREVPAYALIVAKGGIKLHPFQPGSCIPRDFTVLEQFPPQPFPELPQGQKYCGMGSTEKGPIVTLEATAMSIDNFIKYSLPGFDRPLFNKTGIPGLFDFHLEFSPDEPTDAGATPADVAGPSIFTALDRQLGLKLEPAKGLGDFLVIDQVQKPSAN